MAQHGGRNPAVYRQIADDLRKRIDEGEWPVDAQMPTLDELISYYGASKNTVDKALGVLRELGVAETIHGLGTFVRKPPPSPASEYEAMMSRLDVFAEEIKQLKERMDTVERAVPGQSRPPQGGN